MWPVFPELSFPRNTLFTMGDAGVLRTGFTPASTAWPTINKAIFCPIYVGAPITAAQLFVINGATVSGNIDVGLYAADGTKIVSAGSTAQAGTSAIQIFNITDTRIGPGVYYIAVALGNTTGTVEGLTCSNAAGAAVLRCGGLAEMTTAFALPATATLASITANLLPLAGLTTSAVL